MRKSNISFYSLLSLSFIFCSSEGISSFHEEDIETSENKKSSVNNLEKRKKELESVLNWLPDETTTGADGNKSNIRELINGIQKQLKDLQPDGDSQFNKPSNDTIVSEMPQAWKLSF